MSRNLKAAAGVLFLSLLAGCASTMVIKDQNQPLGPDDAIVLTKINASAGNLVLSTGGMDDIYTAPIAEAGRSVDLEDGDNLLALRLKKGQTYKVARYSMRAFYGTVFSFKDPLKFTPAPEGMIYIGDILLDPQFSSAHITGVRSGVADNEVETIKQLRQKYPALFEKYRYQKALAQ
ncbi:MAG TPA: hypothetical protein VFV71_03065 [Burkholderiales bacterium]|nr:hypothetical protein [Burkholderiales bacterium]